MKNIKSNELIEEFKEEISDQIKKGHAYKCLGKLLNEKEKDPEIRNNKCLSCNCGDLESQCKGNYYPLIKIAEDLWNIQDIYKIPNYQVN